jgi:hypothetical protein
VKPAKEHATIDGIAEPDQSRPLPAHICRTATPWRSSTPRSSLLPSPRSIDEVTDIGFGWTSSTEGGEGVEKFVSLTAQRGEVALVGGLHVGQRARDEGATGRRETQLAGPCVGGIQRSLDQAARLQLAQNLAGHHRIGSRLLGEPGLSRRMVAMLGQPPQAREEHELDVG